jgi:crotonobetaine/carnitine-CoA ligase
VNATQRLFETQQWETFQHLWDEAVAHYGQHTFLAFQDEADRITEWTYQAFDTHVEQVAATLTELGVGKGHSIHVCLKNSPIFVALWLAASRLGAYFVPVDPNSSARDIAQQVSRVHPTVGVYSTERSQTYQAGLVQHQLTTIEVSEGADLTAGLRETSNSASRDLRPTTVADHDLLAIMFTSGTTSEPKGVELTQANYASAGLTMAEAAELQPHHRWLVTLPLFHGNAQFYCFAAAIAAGASVGLTHKFSASRWVDQTRELSATHASLFAAPIRMILARTAPETQPANLEHVWFAQSLGSGHFKDFTYWAGVRPRQLYGMTETLAVVSYDSTAAPAHDQIGWPVPGRQVRLLDPITNQPVAPNTPGVITVGGRRGLDLFKGYLAAPEINDRVFSVDADGTEWFSTGDLATQDDTGQLRFVGRVDDVIKVSGENVSLTEVESALAEAPGILEVAVVAKPDPIRDVVPVAYYVPRQQTHALDEATLIEWAAAHLVPAARPREWHQLAELPRTSVGKIRRFQLTEI